MTKKSRAAGYGRISTIKQEKGTSKPEQERKIKKLCKEKNYVLHKFYSDTQSGKEMSNRADIQELITDAKNGKFQVLIITKLDRVGRSVRQILNFYHLIVKELGLKLLTVDESIPEERKARKMWLSWTATYADFEREMIIERTQSGRMARWKSGQAFMGITPYGYRWDKKKNKMVVVDKEANIYKQIVSMYLDQHLATAKIANHLSDQAIPSPSYRKRTREKKKLYRWSDASVLRILRNKAYTGKPVYNQGKDKDGQDKQPIPFKLPRLITDRKWQQIQDRIDQQKWKPKKQHKDIIDKFMSYEVLYCGECGSKMKKVVYRKTGTPYIYYVCNLSFATKKQLTLWGKEKCILKSIKSDLIDDQVFEQIVELLADPLSFSESWLRDVDRSELTDLIKRLRRKQKSIDKFLGKAFVDYEQLNSATAQKAFLKGIRKKETELSSITGQLETATEDLKDFDNKIDRLEQFRQRVNGSGQGLMGYLGSVENEFRSVLYDLPFADKKRLIESVISPESGGKIFVRYLRSNDFLEQGGNNKPITDQDPIIDLRFDLDIDRVENIIAGLDKRFSKSNDLNLCFAGKTGLV